jgi:hypothetical protein
MKQDDLSPFLREAEGEKIALAALRISPCVGA